MGAEMGIPACGEITCGGAWRTVVGQISLMSGRVGKDPKERREGAMLMTQKLCSWWREQHVPRS